jgi:ABC-type multidrug transport system permease subunit
MGQDEMRGVFIFLSPVFLSPIFLSAIFLSAIFLSPIFLSPIFLSPIFLSASILYFRGDSSIIALFSATYRPNLHKFAILAVFLNKVGSLEKIGRR